MARYNFNQKERLLGSDKLLLSSQSSRDRPSPVFLNNTCDLNTKKIRELAFSIPESENYRRNWTPRSNVKSPLNSPEVNFNSKIKAGYYSSNMNKRKEEYRSNSNGKYFGISGRGQSNNSCVIEMKNNKSVLENKSLNEKMPGLQNTNRTLNQNLNEANNEIEKLNKDRISLKENERVCSDIRLLLGFPKKLKLNSDDFFKIKQEVCLLKRQTDQNKILLSSIPKLQDEITNLNLYLVKKRSKIKSLKSKVQIFEGRFGRIGDNMQIKVEEIKSEVNEDKIKFEENLKSEIEKIKSEAKINEDNLNKKYELDIEKIKSQYKDLIKKLENDLDEKNETNKLLKVQLSESKKQYELDIEKLKSQHSKILNELKKDLDEKNETIKHLKIQLLKSKKQYELDIEKIKSQHKSILNELKKDLDEKNKTIKLLSIRLLKSKKQYGLDIEKIQSQLKDLHTKLENDLNEKNETNKNLKIQLLDSKKQNELEIEKLYSHHSDILKKLKNDIYEKDEIIIFLKIQLLDSRKQSNIIIKDSIKIQEQINALENKSNDKQIVQEYDSLFKKSLKFKERKAKLVEKVEESLKKFKIADESLIEITKKLKLVELDNQKLKEKSMELEIKLNSTNSEKNIIEEQLNTLNLQIEPLILIEECQEEFEKSFEKERITLKNQIANLTLENEKLKILLNEKENEFRFKQKNYEEEKSKLEKILFEKTNDLKNHQQKLLENEEIFSKLKSELISIEEHQNKSISMLESEFKSKEEHLKGIISTLETKINDYSENEEKNNIDYDNKLKEIQNLEHEKRKLLEELSGLKSSLKKEESHLNAEITALKSQLNTLTKEISENKSKAINLEDEKYLLESKLKEYESNLKSLEATQASEIIYLEQKHAEEISKMQDSFEHQLENISNLRYTEIINKLEEKLKQTEVLNKQEKDKLDEKIFELENSRKKLIDEGNIKSIDLINAKSEQIKIENELKEYIKSLTENQQNKDSEKNKKIERLEQDLNKSKNEIAKKSEENENLSKLLSTADLNKDQLEKKISSLESENRNSTKEHNDYSTELKKLKEEFNFILERERKNFEENLVRVQDELNKANNTNFYLNSQLEHLKTQLSSKVKKFEVDIDAKNKSIFSLENQNQVLNSRCKTLEGQVENFNSTQKRITDQLEQKEKDVNELNLKVNILENELNLSRNLNSGKSPTSPNLSHNSPAAERELNTLKERIGIFEKNNSDLSKALSSKDSELREMKERLSKTSEQYKVKEFQYEQTIKTLTENQTNTKISDEIGAIREQVNNSQEDKKLINILMAENEKLVNEKNSEFDDKKAFKETFEKMVNENKRLRSIISNMMIFK